MPTRGVGAMLAAACLFLCSRLGRAGAFLVRAPAPVSLHGAGTCRARGWTAARRQAAGCRSVKLSARHDSVSWSEEDEVEVCARIASSIKRAHARPDARLQHNENCVRPPQDGELFGLMQSVLLKVAHPPARPWRSRPSAATSWWPMWQARPLPPRVSLQRRHGS